MLKTLDRLTAVLFVSLGLLLGVTAVQPNAHVRADNLGCSSIDGCSGAASCGTSGSVDGCSISCKDGPSITCLAVT